MTADAMKKYDNDLEKIAECTRNESCVVAVEGNQVEITV